MGGAADKTLGGDRLAGQDAPGLERLKSYEDGAWRAVERDFAGRLMAYIRRRVPDADSCQDVLQETLLGALGGIERFDPRYSLEQYLFGICRNRTIDHLRRRRLPAVSDVLSTAAGADEEAPAEERRPAPPAAGPARTVMRAELREQAEELLARTLRAWIDETWEKEAYPRLMVVEALLCAGWRNKEVLELLEQPDPSAAAGIKLRALRRMQELAAAFDAEGVLLPLIRTELGAEAARIDLDVARVWQERRLSCPSRVWLGRYLAEEGLAPGCVEFLEFHLHKLACAWCQANLDDLGALHEEDDLEPLLEALQSTRRSYLEGLTAGG